MKELAGSLIDYLNNHQTHFILIMLFMALSLTISITKINFNYAISRKE